MKKIIYSLFVGLTIVLTSCGETQNPLDYNNKIIGEQTKIMNLILSFGSQNTDMNQIEGIRLKLVDQCAESIGVLEKMPEFDGSTRMRDAGIKLFKFYHEVSKTSYKEMIEIMKKGEGITEQDISRIETLQSDLTMKEQPLDIEFQAAQQEFAKKNKLQIQANPLQNQIDNL